MTPDQLLGLQRHARAKTVTLTPEITIEDPDAIPAVIASGTQQSVPIEITDVSFPVAPQRGGLGALIGFVLVGAWTTVEILVIALS